MGAAAPKGADNVPTEEKERLLRQHLTAASVERYSLHAAELRGEEVNKTRVDELEKGITDIEAELSKVKGS